MPKKLINIEEKSEIDKVLVSCDPQIELNEENIISSGFVLGKNKI